MATTTMDELDLSKDPGPTVNAAIWSTGAVSTVFLLLRIYCKQIKAKGLWWDDYLLIAAWVRLSTVLSELRLCTSL